MKKLLAIVLVASFAFVGAINASAVTIEELQAQIATLLQQIAALSGTSTPAPATTTCFSTDLQQGMTSNDVKLLQEKLGVINTGYFGPLTLSAVKTFQGQNSIPTTGYVGPMTRAALNAKYCVTTPVTTPTTTVTTAPVADATEGTLSNTTSPTFVETTLKKGDTQKAILATKLEAKNSDIAIKRADVTLTGASIQPWKTFSTIELYVNGTLIKGIPAIKDNFLENIFGADYTLRFDNISFNIPKSGSADVVLKATVLSNPENINATTFTFKANAFRGLDGMGIDQYSGTQIASAALAPAAASTGTLAISLNANTPKTSYILGSKTATSADKEIAKFDVKAENRDVTIKTLKVTMTDSDANKLVSAVKLYDGSTLLASVAGPGAGAATFTNLAVLIAKDTTKTLTVKVDLKPIDGTTIIEGGTTSATITPTATNITAIDSNDDMLGSSKINSGTDDTDGNGNDATAITAKTVTAWTKAPTIALVSTNIVKTTQAGSKDVADATIVYNVTANNGDIYIRKYDNADEWNVVTGPANNGYTFTSTADVVTANAKDFYIVRNGETKSFTITGRIEGADAFAKMAVTDIYWWNEVPVAAHDERGEVNRLTTDSYDLSTFETTSVYLNDPTN